MDFFRLLQPAIFLLLQVLSCTCLEANDLYHAAGSSVKFTLATPASSATWKKDSANLPADARRAIASEGHLTITGLKKEDTGKYEGPNSEKFDLLVYVPLNGVVKGTITMTLATTDTATWTHNEKNKDLSSDTTSYQTEPNTKSVTFLNLKKADSGMYVATITTKKKAFFIQVHDEAVTVSSFNQLLVGKNLVLTCTTAAASCDWWWKDNQLLAKSDNIVYSNKNKKVTLKDFSAANDGLYVCVCRDNGLIGIRTLEVKWTGDKPGKPGTTTPGASMEKPLVVLVVMSVAVSLMVI